MCLTGLSLGEYCALVFAGVLSFEDGLKVVKARAESMAAAATVGGLTAPSSSLGVQSVVLQTLLLSLPHILSCRTVISRSEGMTSIEHFVYTGKPCQLIGHQFLPWKQQPWAACGCRGFCYDA